MKKFLITLITAVTLGARALSVNYTVTNDLNTTVAVFYWTNTTGTTYVYSLSNNIAPGADYVFSLATNGPAGLGICAINATAYTLIPWAQIQGTNTYASQLFASAMSIAAPSSETVPQLQTVLKSYYVTGAIPTEQNFWEWIDTEFWYINYCATNASAAETAAISAANSSTIAAAAMGTVGVGSSFLPTNETYFSSGITNISVSHIGGGNMLITFSFGTPFADTNYIVGYPTKFSGAVYNQFGSGNGEVSKTTTNYTVQFAGNVSSIGGTNYFFQFYPFP